MTGTATRIAAGSCVGVVAAFAAAVFVSNSAFAATYTVTTNADSGTGSLRDAIASVNSAGGTNTIDFASGANGTITLTTGELHLTGSQTLTITGNGASNTVIDGDALSRVFEVDSGVTLDLSGVTVQNGLVASADGGGILVNGNLNLSDSSITGNVSNDDYGAGIANGSGTVTITQTTVSDNTGTGGSGEGAVNFGGTLNIVDSTFVGNDDLSSNSGGAIFSEGAGTVNVTDSTFDDNTAGEGGAINAEAGSVSIVDSTLASNPGDDLYNSGDATITVTGSILADTGDGQSCSAAVTDGGFNIDDGTSCGFSAGTDHQSTGPDLAALASNGGPTQTMALNTGSPAIDAGQSGAACTSVNGSLDQRGFQRPDVAGTACDIGAYEFGAAAPTPTPATVPVPSSGAGTGSAPASPWGILAIFGIAGFLVIMAGLRGRNRRPI